MREQLQAILETFDKNIDAVLDLMGFDDVVLNVGISALQKVQKRLGDAGYDNPRFGVKSTIQSLENIRQNESLRPHYEIMNNQCLVLLVSYFSSAVTDVFEAAIADRLKHGPTEGLLKQDLKFSIAELYSIDFNLSQNIGTLFAAKKEISFQDMKSIARAFKNFLGYEPPKDETVNNIVASLACRHAIVHDAAIANGRTIHQMCDAVPRAIKCDLADQQKIQFEPSEIKLVAQSMKEYMATLVSAMTVVETNGTG